MARKPHGEKVGTMTFWYSMIDVNNGPINPRPLELEANDLGHALQKIAACLADDCVEVKVWLGYSQTARLKLVEKRK